MACFAKPRSSGGTNELRCANGELGAGWNKCVEKESIRVQCPQGTYPCNGLRGEAGEAEFKCDESCEASERVSQCQGRTSI